MALQDLTIMPSSRLGCPMSLEAPNMGNIGLVNSIGLFLDIVGVVLLFRFGLPPDVSKTGGTVGAFGGGKSKEEAKGEYEHHERMSWIALGCLVIGFLSQIISNFL